MVRVNNKQIIIRLVIIIRINNNNIIFIAINNNNIIIIAISNNNIIISNLWYSWYDEVVAEWK